MCCNEMPKLCASDLTTHVNNTQIATAEQVGQSQHTCAHTHSVQSNPHGTRSGDPIVHGGAHIAHTPCTHAATAVKKLGSGFTYPAVNNCGLNPRKLTPPPQVKLYTSERGAKP